MARTGLRSLLALGTLAALLAAPAPAAHAQGPAGFGAWEADAVGGYATTHVIVRLRPGVEITETDDGRRTLRAAGAAPDAGAIRPRVAVRRVVDLDEQLATWSVQDIAPAQRRPPARPALARQLGLDRYCIVTVPAGTDTPALAAALLARNDLIEHAEVDGIGAAALAPNDPAYVLQWGLSNSGQTIQGQPGLVGADINVASAWDLTTGSSDIVLAVLDSGIQEHSEFAGRIVPGWNSVLNSDNTADNCSSHGTHVAGIAAARGNNNSGVVGTDWNVSIMPVKVLGVCTGLESELADGIAWAVDHGADVINMSLQYNVGSEYLHQQVRYAYMSNVTMVAASGNQGFSGGVAYPARWCETIAVGGTDNRDVTPSWSNEGPEVDLAAPGQDIYSCVGTSSYGYRFGTSFSAPFVSGIVTLMLSVDPTLSVEEIRATLTETAVDLATPGFDEKTGWGRVDAAAAVQRTFLDALDPDGDVNGDGIVGVDDIMDVVEAWGICDPDETCTPCPGDLNRDFRVDIDDIVAVVLGWTR